MPHKPLPKGTILVKRGNFKGWAWGRIGDIDSKYGASGTYGPHNGTEILDGDVGVICNERPGGGWCALIRVIRTGKAYRLEIGSAWRKVTLDNTQYLTQAQKVEVVKAKLFVASLT